MWLIAGLILVAALLLVAELVLLPGLTLAGIGAFAAGGAAVWIAFARYGTRGGLIVLAVVVVISVVATVLALRANTWQRLSLKQRIDSSSQQMPQQDSIKEGDRGMTVSRLAPMGKVSIGSRTYEAKSIDAYIDQNTAVEVCGFDNFNIIVKKIN